MDYLRIAGTLKINLFPFPLRRILERAKAGSYATISLNRLTDPQISTDRRRIRGYALCIARIKPELTTGHLQHDNKDNTIGLLSA